MASSRWLHSSLIFLWHSVAFFRGIDECKLGILPATAWSNNPSWSGPIDGNVRWHFHFFGGRRYSDWIPTVPWPWAVLALSTKQYVHTYHETRHKSLSLRWTLNQVVVSGWGKKGLLRTRGAKRKHPVHHIIAYVKKTTRLGNVKGALNVFIRLFLQTVGWKLALQRMLYVFGSRHLNFFDPSSRPWLYISGSVFRWGHMQTVDSPNKKMTNMNLFYDPFILKPPHDLTTLKMQRDEYVINMSLTLTLTLPITVCSIS